MNVDSLEINGNDPRREAFPRARRVKPVTGAHRNLYLRTPNDFAHRWMMSLVIASSSRHSARAKMLLKRAPWNDYWILSRIFLFSRKKQIKKSEISQISHETIIKNVTPESKILNVSLIREKRKWIFCKMKINFSRGETSEEKKNLHLIATLCLSEMTGPRGDG